jgi:hypothetical protein
MFIEVTFRSGRRALLNLSDICCIRDDHDGGTCIERRIERRDDVLYLKESYDEIKRIMRYVGKLGTDEPWHS